MKPSLLKNGRVQGNDSSFGSCLTFSCDPGHTLVGDEEICCIEEGVWNGTVPECITGNVNRISSFFWVHKVDDGRWNQSSGDGDLETFYFASGWFQIDPLPSISFVHLSPLKIVQAWILPSWRTVEFTELTRVLARALRSAVTLDTLL